MKNRIELQVYEEQKPVIEMCRSYRSLFFKRKIKKKVFINYIATFDFETDYPLRKDEFIKISPFLFNQQINIIIRRIEDSLTLIWLTNEEFSIDYPRLPGRIQIQSLKDAGWKLKKVVEKDD